MNCEDLIGYQLISIDDSQITVKKNDGEYRISIDEDYGDCCGFNEITTQLFISEDELNRNPIITNVKIEDMSSGEEDRAVITFFGEYKPMATIDAMSSSGSGWAYGACVSIVCDELDINEIISQW